MSICYCSWRERTNNIIDNDYQISALIHAKKECNITRKLAKYTAFLAVAYLKEK